MSVNVLADSALDFSVPVKNPNWRYCYATRANRLNYSNWLDLPHWDQSNWRITSGPDLGQFGTPRVAATNLHPQVHIGGTDYALVIVSWQSNFTGQVNIEFSFGDMSLGGGDGVDVFLLRGQPNSLTAAWTGTLFENTLQHYSQTSIANGDILALCVDRKNDSFFDTTSFSLKVTEAVPNDLRIAQYDVEVLGSAAEEFDLRIAQYDVEVLGSVENPPLALTASLNPTTINPGQTSVLTVTRSGGGTGSAVTFSQTFNHPTNTPVSSLPGITGTATIGTVGGRQAARGGPALTVQFTAPASGTLQYDRYTDDGNMSLEFNNVVVQSQSNTATWNTATISVNVGDVIRFTINGGFVGISNVQITNIINEATDTIIVTLSSSATGVATVPASVVIPQNQLSATVNVTGVSGGTADIAATYGSASDVETITVDTFIALIVVC